MDDRLARIQSSLDDFERGDLDVEGIQSRLDAHAATLDNRTPNVLRELRDVESDSNESGSPSVKPIGARRH